jgi:putative flippase GtrA
MIRNEKIGEGWNRIVVRWLKFNAVGGIGIVVQLVVLAALKNGLHLDYLLATAMAVEAAVVHNFLWHERFTWADRSTGQGFTRFLKFNLATGLFSIAGNTLLMKLLAGSLAVQFLLANGIAITICSIFNFAMSDRFVFRTHTMIPDHDQTDLISSRGTNRYAGAQPTTHLPASVQRDKHAPSNRRSGVGTVLQQHRNPPGLRSNRGGRTADAVRPSRPSCPQEASID